MKGICIAGIDTGVGKTIVSALITGAFGFDYWKPIQAGDLDASDSINVRQMSTSTHIFKERFRLSQALSPHQAAQIDGVQIKTEDFILPQSQKPILVETAGGIMSPYSLQATNLDMMRHLNLPVIVVVKNYLGSINHTLMSVSHIQNYVPLLGLIISGEGNAASEEAYESLGKHPILHRVPSLNFNAENMEWAKGEIKKSLSSTFARL